MYSIEVPPPSVVLKQIEMSLGKKNIYDMRYGLLPLSLWVDLFLKQPGNGGMGFKEDM